ncbi:hypothetical protein ETD86_00865 [Nonomuraea turkmeniaca]|uniref:Neutral/alkaline non-lysosomal ceramidase N-terminal domain-containing protein n=1 Tax=Nonomuraea turkmeniaca TaxID=103838 RepID=A0A5S4FXE1_9ACTN|nr:hypothetical protein [Nonomuraea turkmeniaca]TMR25435.1 hypothetical protein ETD86_00865 [Nonomuraea turkmeniaca]
MRVGHGIDHLEIVAGEAMGGYADRLHGLSGVLDALEIHAVTFADGERRFALIVADLVCVNGDVVERVRAAVRELGVDSCWVAATHTHAGPEAGCSPGGAPTPPELAERVVSAALRAAAAALKGEGDATVHTERVQVPDLASRRHLPEWRAIDIPVDVIVVSSAGRVAGAVVVSPVHPTVLPADNHHASADLSGGIRRALRTDACWVVVATGAAGDISTRHTRRGRDQHEIDRLGTLVATRLHPTVQPADAPRNASVVPAVSTRVRLAAKRPEEAVVPDDVGVTDERGQSVLEQGRRIARDMMAGDHSDPYEIEVQAVGLDAVTLVAVPGELFLELGEKVRAAAAAPGIDVVVIGYANGYLGYLPSRDTPTSYETLVSPVAEGSGELVVAAAIDAAGQIMNRRSRDGRV